MKSIKFRRYDPYAKKMEIVNQMFWDAETNEASITRNNSINGVKSILVSPVMQFTGFKDLNGREIFEGDIIKYVNELYKVEFFNGGFFLRDQKVYEGDSDLIYGIHFSDMADLEKNCEIVGNVFEDRSY